MVLFVPHSTYQYIFSCTLHQYISAVQCIASIHWCCNSYNTPVHVLHIFHKLVLCVHSTNIHAGAVHTTARATLVHCHSTYHLVLRVLLHL